MKTHYSSAELAAMKLPGLPTSEPGVRMRATKQGWASRKVECKGGKGGMRTDYQPPKAIMDMIRHRKLGAVIEQAVAIHKTEIAPVASSAPAAVANMRGLTRRIKAETDLDDKDRARRDAALVLCHKINEARAITGCSAKKAIRELASHLINGLASPELVDAANTTYTKPRQGGQTVASLISRLQKMFAAYKEGEKAGDVGLYLVPGKCVKRGHTPVDIHAFLVHYCRPSQPPVMEAWKAAEGWYLSHGLTRPAVDTWYRINKELPVTIKYRGRMTGSAYRALLPFIKRDVSMFKANDLWVGDGHSFKAKVQSPRHGQPFVPEVTVILDWVSRKIVGWSVDVAESTIAVSAAFRHAQQCTRARPLIYYSDNGSGQTGKHIDAPVIGTLARQGIAHETGIPGNPQGRGIIERIWQVTLIPLARTYATCTWNGTDKETTRKMLVALNKKDGSGEKLLPSFQQFLLDLDACINHYNSTHKHRELGGMTPNEAYQVKLDPDSVDMGITDQELAVQWMPYETRTPERGVVSLFNNEYSNKELKNLLAEGEQVNVRFDIHNAERVWLYRMDGRFLCAADWDAHKRAAFPVAYVEQKREERAEGKIKRGEAIIREAQAELGNVIEGETLIPVQFPEVQREELVPVEFAPVEREEAGSYMDTVMLLYGKGQPEEEAGNEVATR